MGPMSVVRVAFWCAVMMHAGYAQLSPSFYIQTCPYLYPIVFRVIFEASLTDPRIGASLIRLHFHDCFVQVCYYLLISI